MADTNLIFASPAHVMSRTNAATLAILARQKGALDPSVFEERPPYFFTAEISSNRIDAYYTRMAESTLRNFAEDATNGVSFQNSHATNKLGFGRSLMGTFIGGQGNGVSRVEADFYTIPGLRLHDVSTDDFILGVRSGIVSDVSVGFFDGQFRCSICGRDMLRDWDCMHIPGMTYDIRDPNGNVIDTQQAVAWIENAHLAEVSAVYDGATPGAAILKAQSEAEQGRITPQAARLIESRYRIRLPSPITQVPGYTLSITGSTTANTNGLLTLASDVATQRSLDGASVPATPAQENAMPMPTEERQVEAGAAADVAEERQVVAESTEPQTESETRATEAEGERVVLDPDPTEEQVQQAVENLLTSDPVTPLPEDEAAREAAQAAAAAQMSGQHAAPAQTPDPVVEQLRGLLIGAGVPNPNDLLGSVQHLISAAGRATGMEQELTDVRGARANLEQTQAQLEYAHRQIRELVSDVAVPEGASVLEAVRVLHSQFRAAQADVARLTPLADDGRAYRSDLVSEALLEGVRAYGADFAEDTYRGVLEAASLDTVKRMRDDWRRIADRQFVPGRVTTDAPVAEQAPASESRDQAQPAAKKSDVPNEAYKG